MVKPTTPRAIAQTSQPKEEITVTGSHLRKLKTMAEYEDMTIYDLTVRWIEDSYASFEVAVEGG